jgi:hypothetical protein
MNSLRLSDFLDGCFCCCRWFVRRALSFCRLVVSDGVVLSPPCLDRRFLVVARSYLLFVLKVVPSLEDGAVRGPDTIDLFADACLLFVPKVVPFYGGRCSLRTRRRWR